MDIENVGRDAQQTAMQAVVERLTSIEKRVEQVCVDLGQFNDRMLGVQAPEAGADTEKVSDPSHMTGIVAVKLSHISTMLSVVESQTGRLGEIG